MNDEEYIVVIDPLSRPEDRFCVAGTKENVAEYFIRNSEHSFQARSLKEIPVGRSLYWVTFDRENWAGSGGGASKLFTSIGDVQEWIIEQIKSWNVDIGRVKFEIFPVFIITKNDEEAETVRQKMFSPEGVSIKKKVKPK